MRISEDCHTRLNLIKKYKTYTIHEILDAIEIRFNTEWLYSRNYNIKTVYELSSIIEPKVHGVHSMLSHSIPNSYKSVINSAIDKLSDQLCKNSLEFILYTITSYEYSFEKDGSFSLILIWDNHDHTSDVFTINLLFNENLSMVQCKIISCYGKVHYTTDLVSIDQLNIPNNFINILKKNGLN